MISAAYGRAASTRAESRLQTPGSGLYAGIRVAGGAELWRSPSAAGTGIDFGGDAKPGQPQFAYLHLPDGERVITVSGGLAYLWSLAQPTAPLRSFEHGGNIYSAFDTSADGRRLATAGDGAQKARVIRIWDVDADVPERRRRDRRGDQSAEEHTTELRPIEAPGRLAEPLLSARAAVPHASPRAPRGARPCEGSSRRAIEKVAVAWKRSRRV